MHVLRLSGQITDFGIGAPRATHDVPMTHGLQTGHEAELFGTDPCAQRDRELVHRERPGAIAATGDGAAPCRRLILRRRFGSPLAALKGEGLQDRLLVGAQAPLPRRRGGEGPPVRIGRGQIELGGLPLAHRQCRGARQAYVERVGGVLGEDGPLLAPVEQFHGLRGGPPFLPAQQAVQHRVVLDPRRREFNDGILWWGWRIELAAQAQQAPGARVLGLGRHGRLIRAAPVLAGPDGQVLPEAPPEFAGDEVQGPAGRQGGRHGHG